MFEDASEASVLAQVRAHTFDPRPLEAGHERIEAITALERLVRQAQAEQSVQIAHLHRERTQMMGQAGHQLNLALGLTRLPQVFELFKSGVIPEPVARSVVRETDALDADDLIVADAEIAPLLPGLTPSGLACRQPGCECGIREADHIFAFSDGGTTTLANAQGLCTTSHHVKHQPGWDVRSHGKTVTWTTPTGHTYRSDPPPLLGHLRQ